MKRIHLVPVVALSLLAGCADNRSMIEIDGRAVPSDATSCKFAPGGENVLGPGLLDVGASLQPTYGLVLYVKNNLADPTATVPEALKAAKAWTANAAKVQVNPSGYVDAFGPNPGLLPVSAENVVPLDGVVIQPAGGTGVAYVEAISGPLGAQLAGSVAVGELRQVVLGISLQGRTLDGAFLESSPWYFPLNVCKGCLPAPTCAAGEVLKASNCFGITQDTAPVCVAP